MKPTLSVLAYVLVTTKPGTSKEIVEARRIRDVKLVNEVFGQYDAVLVVGAPNLHELSKRIYEVVEKLPNVVHTETLIAVPPRTETLEKAKKTEMQTSLISFRCPNCNNLNEQGSTFCIFCGFTFKPVRSARKRRRA